MRIPDVVNTSYWTGHPDNLTARKPSPLHDTGCSDERKSPVLEAKLAGEPQSQVPTIKPSDRDHLSRTTKQGRRFRSRVFLLLRSRPYLRQKRSPAVHVRYTHNQLQLKDDKTAFPNAPTPPKGSFLFSLPLLWYEAHRARNGGQTDLEVGFFSRKSFSASHTNIVF